MVQLSVEVPEDLAQRIRPLTSWLPTVLELSLVGFHTQASGTATELVQFLSTEPSPEKVLEYHASEQTQARLRRLLALNEAGLLNQLEQRELDELQGVEHSVIMLKAQAASRMSGKP